jgi:hypothetical protein
MAKSGDRGMNPVHEFADGFATEETGLLLDRPFKRAQK